MLHVLLTFWGSGMGHFPEDSLICVIYDAAAKGPLVVWDVPKHDIPRVCVCVSALKAFHLLFINPGC